MSRAFPFVVVVLAALVATPARGQSTAFTFEQAVYSDAKEGPLKAPEGVACNDAGALVVADTGKHRLLTFVIKDRRVTGGTELKLAELTTPVRLQLDGKGNILALDGRSHRIVRLDASGAFAGYIEPRGPGLGEIVPASFKVDSHDNVYVLDMGTRHVLQLDGTGVVTRQLDLPQTGLFTDIAVDPAGTILLVDAAGAVVWSAEAKATAFRPLTKSLKDRMNFPTDITVKRGRIYLLDKHGSGVIVLGNDGSFQGRQLSMGWNEGLLYYPTQLCVTAEGDAFIADRLNNRVQMFSIAK